MEVIKNLTSIELLTNLEIGDYFKESSHQDWKPYTDMTEIILNKKEILQKWEIKKKEVAPMTPEEYSKYCIENNKITDGFSDFKLKFMIENIFKDGEQNEKLKHKDIVAAAKEYLGEPILNPVKSAEYFDELFERALNSIKP